MYKKIEKKNIYRVFDLLKLQEEVIRQKQSKKTPWANDNEKNKVEKHWLTFFKSIVDKYRKILKSIKI